MSKKETITKILKLKDSRKKELEIEVKKAADRAETERVKLLALEKDYNDTLNVFNEKNIDGSLDASNLSSYYDFLSRIDNKIREQKVVYTKKQDELSAVKRLLVNAHKDKKVFEIMKEKAVRKEAKARFESEQKEADFFSISRKSR
ncbi:MAG: flagellar export protein FliJ [Nitrospirota bacterium]|nr:flagellar export protein FliJ [Nitrospirota bacterium]